MKKTIWVPDELVEGIKEAAWRERKSVSSYLVGLHCGAVEQTDLKKTPLRSDVKSSRGADFFKPMPKKKS